MTSTNESAQPPGLAPFDPALRPPIDDRAPRPVSELVANIVEANLRHGPMDADQIVDLIDRVGRALSRLAPGEPAPEPDRTLAGMVSASSAGHAADAVRGQGALVAPDQAKDDRPDWMPEGTFGPQRPPWAPAVAIEKSVSDDHIVCLEDGRKMQMLKRHLRRKYGMSAEQYVRKWGLPEDYPLACRNYRLQRRQIASQQGFQRLDGPPAAKSPKRTRAR